MARSLFGGTDDDRVEIVWEFGARRIPTLANKVTVTFYDAETGGNPVTDLALNVDGTSPVTAMTTDSDGYLGAFYGPDLVTALWAQAGESSRRFLMVTTDAAGVSAAADRAEQAALDAEAAAASVAREQPGGVAGLDAAGLLFPSRVPDSVKATTQWGGIRNPGFETGVIEPHVLENGTTAIVDTTLPHSGTYGGRLVVPARSTYGYILVANGAKDDPSVHMPVQLGDTIRASAWVRAGTIVGTPECRLFLHQVDSAGVLVDNGQGTRTTAVLGSVQTEITAELTIDNPATAYVAVALAVNNSAANDVVRVDDMSLDKVNRANTAKAEATFSQIEFRPVNVREGYGTDDAAVRAAVADAKVGGRALYFPAATYSAVGDLVFDMDGLHVWGDGDKTRLNMTDGAVLLDGFSSAHLMRPSLRDLTIVRSGTVGPALHAKGAGVGTGVARLTASNLDVQSSGDGMLYEGSYIASFQGCYFRNSAAGVRVKLDTATSAVGGNLLSFHGGESQGNSSHGLYLSDARGVNFYGFGIEGNGGNGALINGECHGVGFYGCYLEANSGLVDLEWFPSTAASGPFVVEGCTFYDYTVDKNQIVYLRAGHGFVNYNRFNDLSPNSVARCIRVDAAVVGEARHNWCANLGGGQLYGNSSASFTTV